MLKLDEKKVPAAHIWKVTALQLISTAFENNLPFSFENDFFKPHDKYKKCIASLEANEEIMSHIFKQIDNYKTQKVSACVEVLANLLRIYEFIDKKDKYYQIIFDLIEDKVVSKNEKIAINLVFRSSLHHKNILFNKKIFNKAVMIFKSSNQSNRSLLLQSFLRLFEVSIIIKLLY